MKKIYSALAAVGISLAGFGVAVWAQTPTAPQVSVINSNDLVQIVPRGQPSAQAQYSLPSLLTTQVGYQKNTTLTGFTYTFGNNQSLIVLTEAGTINSGTIVLAQAPSDGDQNCFYSQSQVTGITITALPSLAILNNAITQAVAASRYCYLYSLSNNAWDRSQ